jgi:hypothetical protein
MLGLFQGWEIEVLVLSMEPKSIVDGLKQIAGRRLVT